eukprot:scaffold14972_cov52-Cyclotella_meneghiniana.AAC.4
MLFQAGMATILFQRSLGPSLSAEHEQPAHVLEDQSVKASGLRAAINKFIVKQNGVVSKDDAILTSDVRTED